MSHSIEELRATSSPDNGQLPYLSKSRLLKYVNCPEEFRYSYVMELKEPETVPMRRGTDIHQAIEEYYYNLQEYVLDTGEEPQDLAALLPDNLLWSDHVEPYISNFLTWERQRFEYASDPLDVLPLAVEDEAWLEAPLDLELPNGVNEVDWMGRADVIYPAAGIPEVDTDRGAVIVDVKTGKTPKEKYRDEGIYLQGEYYKMLFESSYDVVAVAGYYPRGISHEHDDPTIGGDMIVSRPSESRRDFIEQTAAALQHDVASQESHFELNEQPLCKYGVEDSQECSFYGACASTWGEPLRHPELFEELIEKGYSFKQIAEKLNMNSTDGIGYARWKLGLN